MAKPSKPAGGPTPAPASKPAASKPVARTEVRNSPIPQTAPPPPRPTTAPKPAQPQQQPPRAATPQSAAVRPAAKAVTHELIARRAYEIWASGQGGSETENWIRAERELRGM